MPNAQTLKTVTTALALAVSTAPLAVVTAQTAAAQEAASYSSGDLDTFTDALLRVADVRQDYTERLQAAGNEEEQAAIVEEANAEITRAIADTDGITVERYTEIAEAASEDQSLNQRIMQRVRDRTGQGE